MRNPFHRLLASCLLLLLAVQGELRAQTDTSYAGRDFWVAFMPNADDGPPDSYILSFAASRDCTVTLSAPASSWTHSLSVGGGQGASYTVPVPTAYQSGSCIVTGTGIHVSATDSVYLYAHNRNGSPGSCDATAVLPTHALGSSYLLQTYPVDRPGAATAACFSVVATQNGTHVSMVLTGQTSTGIPAGTTIDTLLNAGQVFQVKGPSGTGDFSGTMVCAQPDKPVAVFAGNSVVHIPSNGIGGDHVYMQMPPVECLGSRWVLTPSLSHGSLASDRVRMTAVEDNTVFTLDGTTLTTLGAGASYEIPLTAAVYLTSSKPALVCQYLDSRHTNAQNQDYGDPAGFVVTPLEQGTNWARFNTLTVDSRAPSVSQWYVNIVMPTAEVSLNRLHMDGQRVTGFTALGSSGFSYVRCPLTQGSHAIVSTGSGFTAFHYGVGENWESYAAPVGGRFHKLNPVSAAAVWDSVDTVVCGTFFTFRGETYTRSEEYPIGTSCNGGTLLRLTLAGHRERVLDTSVCDSLVWRGTVYREPGTFIDTVHMPDGCDSLIGLFLHQVYPSSSLFLDTALCEGYALAVGDTVLTRAGHHEWLCRTVHGCDSSVSVDLRILPVYDSTWRVTIGDTDTYIWVDGNEYAESIDTTFRYSTVAGCDSLLRLVLNVIEHPTDPLLWVPNVFTPGEETNNRFEVVTKGMQEVSVVLFTRWGDRVCRFDGLTEYWDGTKEGRPCKQDTYVWLIRCVAKDGTRLPEQSGTVTLLR